MKFFKEFILILFLIIFAAPLYSMKISFFVGESTLIRNGKNVSLAMGDNLSNGDIIKTGKGALVEILYDDNSKITIQSNSVIQVSTLNVAHSGEISLISGQLKCKFIKQKNGESRIATPTSVAAVRGTEFSVSVSRGGDSMIYLNEGGLDIAGTDKNTTLKKGEYVESEVGGETTGGRKKINSDEWRNSRDESLPGNINDRADAYERHIDKFQNDSQATSKNIKEINDSIRKASSKDQINESGRNLNQCEKNTENNLLMNSASRMNINNIIEDYKDNDSAIKFKSTMDKSDAVREQQMKNYQAIQKVREEYKEAYDKIMKKFQDDKSGIYKNLDDMKKTLPTKNQ